MRQKLLSVTTLFGISLLVACSSSSTTSDNPDAGGTHPGDSGGTQTDTGADKDSGSKPDAGGKKDGGSGEDATSTTDGGSGDDATTEAGSDAGTDGGSGFDGGFGDAGFGEGGFGDGGFGEGGFMDGGFGQGDASADGEAGLDSDAGSGNWSCLGTAGSAAGDTITYTIKFVDRTSGAGNAGLSAVLCSTGTLLSDCKASNTDVDAVFGSGTTDDTGSVTFNVSLSGHNLNSDGVAGFIYLTDSTHAIYDQQVFVDFIENQHLVVKTMTPAQATSIASSLNVTLDLVHDGILGGQVIDCNYQPASGATVTDDQEETIAYFSSGNASPTATATDGSGEYIILNAQFSDTGLLWDNAAADDVGGLTVAPTAGMVTTVAIPHTD